MDVIFGAILILMVGIGIIAGISLKVKEGLIEPAQQRKKDKAIANYKYKEFISAVQEVAAKAVTTTMDEHSLTMKEVISNGVETIGSFEYIVRDKIRLKSNSVGNIKIHSYTLTVRCSIRPTVELSLDSKPFDALNQSVCKDILHELRSRLINDPLYKDAIAVNQLR